MATSSKITTTPPAASTTPTKSPFAKKVVGATPASKATNKKMSAPETVMPASKPAATAKSAPKKSSRKNTVTPEERYHMIATAAYFCAEQRGFVGGYEMEDWISSEGKIDAMLIA